MQQQFILTPAVHRSDPITSFKAAEKAPIKGQALEVLNALKKYPNRTPRELSRDSGLDYHLVQKRLSVLRTNYLAYSNSKRVCEVSGNECGVWNPV